MTSHNDEKSDAAPKRRKRDAAARTWINMWAAALSVIWLGGLSAFSFAFYQTPGVFVPSLSPGIWAGLLTSIAVPLGLIWFGATVLKRLLDLNETSLRLATISRELTDPGTTAANDVAKLGATIRKELDGLNREIETAVSRVSELESRLKQHTTMIDETAKRVDKRTSDIATRLSEEREKVDAVTRSLSNEAKLISDTLDMQAFAINKASTEATEALAQANETLSTHTSGLDKAALEAAETTKTIAEDIERETGKLETVSASARSRAEAISARFAEQHKSMTETLDAQGDQQTKLDAAMEQQQRLVSTMAETVARQVQRIEESVAEATSNFANAVDEARDKAADAGMSFEDRTKAIAETAEAAADRLGAAADAVTLLSREAQEDLENQIRTTDKALLHQAADAHAVLEQQVKQAKTLLAEYYQSSRGHLDHQGQSVKAELDEQSAAALARLQDQSKAAQTQLNDQSSLAHERLADLADAAQVKLVEQDTTARALLENQTKDASAALTGQADHLTEALEKSLNHLRDRLSELTDKGSSAMIGRADELDEALRAGEESMRILSERLDASIQGVQTGSEDAGRLFAETADAFEARMAQFPAHADDAVSKVRNQISAQIEALARLADAAAGKAHELTHAIEKQNASTSEVDENQDELFLDNPMLPHEALSTEMPKAGFSLRPSARTTEAPAHDVSRTSPNVHGEESETRRRARLGTNLEDSIKGRLRTTPTPDPNVLPNDLPAGLRAAQSTGALKAEEMEDISSFTVKRSSDQQLSTEERPAPTSPGNERGGWRKILTSMDKREIERNDTTLGASVRSDDATFQRDALMIIEKLQALSIDLDRALEDAPSTELLDRYMNGERNVFARRIASFTGPEMLERIARTYRDDAEFRTVTSRYIESFEGLLRAARGRDRENILVETYLTSQTGKVYMILGTATGHLK